MTMPPPNLFPWVSHLEIADTFWKRTLGLMGKTGLAGGHGLLISPCRSIHTCFMRFPIDVVFLDHDNDPLKVVRGVKPWRMIWGGWKAASVLEVQSGWLPRIQTVTHPATQN
jgi:uncharacterized protein